MQNLTKSEIINFLSTNKNFLQKEFHLKNIGFFGSYAKDKTTKESDIDLFYELDESYKLSFNEYLKLEEFFQKKFNKKIELINLKKINPLVKLNAKEDFIYV